MKTHLALVLVAGMFGLAVATLNSSALADEEEISIKEAPAPIQRALKGVKVAEIERETKTVYEVELRVGRHEVVLTLSPDGKLLGIEIEEGDGDDDDDDDDDRNKRSKKNRDDDDNDGDRKRNGKKDRDEDDDDDDDD